MCMEMDFRSYQQACEGMLEAKDKKQYLKNHADKLIELFKTRDKNSFFYWKFCHDVYHLTEYCLFNVKRICKEPKLAKLHDLAEYDKDLYHMGEYTYSNGEFLKWTKKNQGIVHPYIMDIVGRYGKREGYQVYCDWVQKTLSEEVKPGTRAYDNLYDEVPSYNFLTKMKCNNNKVWVGKDLKRWQGEIKTLYQNQSARTNDGSKSMGLKF